MKELIADQLVANRESVKDEPSSIEIEYFQNQAYALTNPTNEFFLFFKKLNRALMDSLHKQKYSPAVIPMTLKRLRDSQHLRTHFVEIFSHDADHIMQGA